MTVRDSIKRAWGHIHGGDPGQIFRDIGSWRHYSHKAYIDTLTYDDDKKRYRIHRQTVTMRDILPTDLAITGSKYRFFRTELDAPERQEKRTETDADGVIHEYLNTSATSNYLYMVNNDINSAMAGTFAYGGINPVIIMALVTLAIVGIIWFFLG